MTISTNYSTPVMVNGFSCRNCSEVDQARKNIDPADPAAGPFGINSTKPGAGLKPSKPGKVDMAALDQAHRQALQTQGSPVLRAYAGNAIAGQFLERLI